MVAIGHFPLQRDRQIRKIYNSFHIFRCKEHLYKRLRPSVGWSVGLSPMMQLRGKLVTSRLLREEEEEEETDYVTIPLCRDSFAPRD
jgi:hypothetical protein